MKLKREELLKLIAERCPDEVEVSLFDTRQRYMQDVRIYGLPVPRSEIDKRLLQYLATQHTVSVKGVSLKFRAPADKVVDILQELSFQPAYDLKCSSLKPDMGDVGCDSTLGVFHEDLPIRHWLGDLGRSETRNCQDLHYKAEQVQEFQWFLECPNCYALRLLDLENLPTPLIWSKKNLQEVNTYYGGGIVNKHTKKGR
jgi:hypothetical protein